MPPHQKTTIPLTEYSLQAIVNEARVRETMRWEVEYTDEFGDCYESLTESEQDSIDRNVYLLEQFGPALPDRYSKPVVTSRFTHMRELRVQHGGEPIRVLYPFDPRRVALLLLGGNKTGDDRWYEKAVPRVDALYERHLAPTSRRKSVNCSSAELGCTEGDMGNKWTTLRAKMTPERRDANRRAAQRMVAGMPLEELRQARNITQTHLASLLRITQASVSKMEKRTDMYVSTLRSFVQAMGGELEIRAIFPEGTVRIEQFATLAADGEPTTQGAGSHK
jgi:DNA-binding transcriptional regulator YiaG